MKAVFHVKDKIRGDINLAELVSIILDETYNIHSKSTALRCMHQSKICERYLGSTGASADRTSDSLFSH